MASTDRTEGPVAALTQTIQSCGCIIGIIALRAGQSRTSCDFDCSYSNRNTGGAYHRLFDKVEICIEDCH